MLFVCLFLCSVSIIHEHENPNLYITMIPQSDNIWIALLNRPNSQSSYFMPSVKAPKANY